MSRDFAVVENGVVANIVVWDGDTETWSPPEGSIVIPIPEGVVAGIGCRYDGSTITSPKD